MGKGGKGGGTGIAFPNSYADMQKLVRLQEDAMRRAADLSAQYGFYDRITPYGSQRFVGTPGEEGFQAITELPGGEQEYLDRARQMRLDLQSRGLGQLESDIFSRPIGGPGDFADSAGEVERATFERAANLLRPDFEREQQTLENSLIQRGLPRSGEAYQEEQESLSRRQGSALENLALSSVGAGRQEQSRLLQSELARRSGMLGELGALGLGSQPPPQFQPTPNIGVGAADVYNPASMVANIQAQNEAQRQASKGAGKGGAAQLGSAALMAVPSFFSGGGKGGKGGSGGTAVNLAGSYPGAAWT